MNNFLSGEQPPQLGNIVDWFLKQEPLYQGVQDLKKATANDPKWKAFNEALTKADAQFKADSYERGAALINTVTGGSVDPCALLPDAESCQAQTPTRLEAGMDLNKKVMLFSIGGIAVMVVLSLISKN